MHIFIFYVMLQKYSINLFFALILTRIQILIYKWCTINIMHQGKN